MIFGLTLYKEAIANNTERVMKLFKFIIKVIKCFAKIAENKILTIQNFVQTAGLNRK
jgi:hypothetical protein